MYEFVRIVLISHVADWVKSIDTTIIYERKRELSEHVLYVIPIESILGRLLVVPLGDSLEPSPTRTERSFPVAGLEAAAGL